MLKKTLGRMMKNYQKTQENEYGQLTGKPVKGSLPASISIEELKGRSVSLLPFSAGALSEARLQQLWHCADGEPDGRCWTYLPYAAFQNRQELQAKLQRQLGFADAMHYCIESRQQAAGWLALLNIRPAQGVIEIGNLYFSHVLRQSAAATEAVFLMLQACFRQGFRRVEWKCDDLNLPSKRAAARFGFQYEGTFRQDRITKGCSRNTAWFSILDEKWPPLEQAYQAWLHPENFDAAGQQKIRLQDFIQLYQKNK